MDYKIIAGDWSDDGHGKTETYIIEVTSLHSLKEMQKNYARNCEKWGHTLDGVAADYEDNSVPEDLIEKMRADGSVWAETADLNIYDDPSLDTYSAMNFVMDFIGLNMPKYNGEAFAWHKKGDDSMPLLVGGYSAQIEKSFGYGLFY